ncbi:unnamed protein product [Ilex paraguariensis]|uniref:RING-type domain-containing protein n=1 Tax=Ilex paraguariensis TaxID=185542 RepID=A0ABC8T3S4_9AQUA
MEDDNATGLARDCDPTSFEFSGKVMLMISILVLLLVLAIIVCFMYTHWFHLRRSPHLRQAHPLALTSYHNNTTTSSSSKGLEPSVLKSLPIFYVSKTHGPPLECAVCLSELENNDMGRVLPKCNHCFHIDCIDMWFHSHSSCPLCRAPVQPIDNPVQVTENPLETVVLILESPSSESGSNSGLSPTSRRAENQMFSTSPPENYRSKSPGLMGITVEVPVTEKGPKASDEMDLESKKGNGFKQPGEPVRSLKRF